MPSISNTTNKALAVPLPGGKTLRLGAYKTGQITPKSLKHPPVKELIESGDLKLAGDTHASTKRPGGISSGRPSGDHGRAGIRKTGNR